MIGLLLFLQKQSLDVLAETKIGAELPQTAFDQEDLSSVG
jgi:hypothetical protein